jgi:hypothetical protein
LRAIPSDRQVTSRVKWLESRKGCGKWLTILIFDELSVLIGIAKCLSGWAPTGAYLYWMAQ